VLSCFIWTLVDTGNAFWNLPGRDVAEEEQIGGDGRLGLDVATGD
jgi:hypothetical protein